MRAFRAYRHLTLLGLGLIFWPAIAAHSAIVLTVKQDGSDVVVIGKGSGPSLFGNDPNIFENPSFGSGDLFGVVADNGIGQSLLVLPSNYVSGTSLNGTSRFSGFTLANLGLSPGVFSWTWGTNSNADSLELRIEPVPAPAPVPAPLPLAGGAMAWSWAKRMRRASRGQRLHASMITSKTQR
jgi:hypothetical protein